MFLHNLVCNLFDTSNHSFFNSCKLEIFLTHLLGMNPQGKDGFH